MTTTTLWNKPENDPIWIMYQRLLNQPAFHTRLGEDALEALNDVRCSLGGIYYDVFNNGGCNLDEGHSQHDISIISEYAKSKRVEVPTFVKWDVYNDGDFESIGPLEMDDFARKIIGHLYLDLTAE